ncbi:hypothetical protein PPL_06112 [Heterostelium album PN500]|uniref:Uncharacterized protein n=1 Tax=Heterostelium pallidum (strain ATCC 26659 / Pp 5 / PN500) TaxID=670386 RepID=D3BC89_HETP5|nr:hypothetical protein PPL_06112 [Heterostelium album PN500]EFA81272.1 hypothetical protein PPL_06112 [Heterostelium album PN500]|eukprot:XP_020433390.1 hypothetical protein PPL_06112 [Heterostelium album PN500]
MIEQIPLMMFFKEFSLIECCSANAPSDSISSSAFWYKRDFSSVGRAIGYEPIGRRFKPCMSQIFYLKMSACGFASTTSASSNSISQGVNVDCSAITGKFKSHWNLNPSNYVPPLYTVVHQHSTTKN